MRATRPTARSAHPFAHFIEADSYPVVSGFILLSRCHPTNPLIARQRCDIRPHILHNGVRLDCFTKIRWHSMDDTACDFFFAHIPLPHQGVYTKEKVPGSNKKSVEGFYSRNAFTSIANPSPPVLLGYMVSTLRGWVFLKIGFMG